MRSLASSEPQSWLSWFLRGLLVVLFLILFTKLFEIQIVKGRYYWTLSEENRIKHASIPALRGRILARGGEELAINVGTKRVYPMGEALAHVTGYLSKVGEDAVGKVNPDCRQKGLVPPTAFVGKTGLEYEYQCRLTGIDGEELVEVNTLGEKIRTLGKREPTSGEDIRTTIDFNLQGEVARLMQGRRGAAVVTTPGGEILALYSEPTFDPNLLSLGEDKEKIAELLSSSELPFFNRVISGTFHPGSVFKPLVSLAALEEKVIDKNFVYTDTGVIKVNEFKFTNWYFNEYGRTEGDIGLARAIARSTDTFFYKIGEMVGPNNIGKWSEVFGLTKETGIDLPGEVKGLIPTPDWKKRVIKESWYLGDTYNMSIGQGYVAVTPIELNTYISAIANSGTLCRPHFLQGIETRCSKTSVSQENLNLVIQGMKEACSQGGTAYTFFDFPAKYGGTEVACKTGTAEVGTDGEPHAWFTFFAPAQNPEIVMTILIEKGGQGSSEAGPIARSIADYYFQALRQ